MRENRHCPHSSRWLGVGACALLLLSGCSPSVEERPQDVISGLAAGLSRADVSQIGFSNGAGPEIQAALEKAYAMTGGIEPQVRATEVEAEDDVARGELAWSWDLPATDQDWSYSTSVELRRTDNGWQPTWAPTMVEPGLSETEALRIRTVQPQRGAITGAQGVTLASEQPIHRVGLDMGALQPEQRVRSAKALAEAVDIDSEPLLKEITAAGDKAWVEAIALRETDFRMLDAEKMQNIPGLLVKDDTRVLARTKGFAAEILGTVVEATAEDLEKSDGELMQGAQIGRGGLQEQFDDTLRGEPGVVVDRVGLHSDGSVDIRRIHQLVAHAPVPGAELRTTLDVRLQEAAQEALNGVKSPSSVVMLRPSDGAVLAVANGTGSKGYPTATLGQYAPGSTFKVVTSLAMLRAGDTPDTVVDCPHTFTAVGTSVANFSGYPKEFEGKVPLRHAVAHSCNTVFAAQYERIDQQSLAEAAQALGIGVPMEPGVPAFPGHVPGDEPAGEHVAAMFGQGRTLVSPLGMARVQASIQAGHVVDPTLTAAGPEAAKAPAKPLTDDEAQNVRILMREVVATGHLKDLGSLIPDTAIGKTGTAEYGNENPPRTHSWVIAGHEDLAAAVFVEDGNLGSITGTPIMRHVLEAAQ